MEAIEERSLRRDQSNFFIFDYRQRLIFKCCNNSDVRLERNTLDQVYRSGSNVTKISSKWCFKTTRCDTDTNPILGLFRLDLASDQLRSNLYNTVNKRDISK